MLYPVVTMPNLALAGGLALGIGGLLRAEVVELSTVADTTLMEIAPDHNLGGATFFNAGTAGTGSRNRALLLFDLNGFIPSGSHITEVSLRLDVVQQPVSGANSSTFGLRRVLQSWGEGVQVPGESPGRGAPAGPGEATWNHRFVSSQTWSLPGGQAGLDFASTASALAPVVVVGDQMVFQSTPALVADVQAWVNQPAANCGWMLLTEAEALSKTARGFAAREGGFGPTLTVQFTPIPEPSVVTLAGLSLVLAAIIKKRCQPKT
jgi:hypothetical protein